MTGRASAYKALGVLALVLIAIALGRISLSNGLARTKPLLALSIDGDNATAAAEAASAVVASDPSKALRLGKAALLRDPTQVKAASSVALLFDIKGKRSQAGALMRYAQSVSRRDLATQLWLIEDAVGRGDVREAIAHYDLALRTSKRAQAILFPILISAISQPDIAQALADKMSAEPGWAGPLLYELARQDAPTPGVTRLFEALSRRKAHYDQRNADLFIQRAVRAGDIDSGWRVYTLVEPASAREILRDGTFSKLQPRAVPFEWELTDQSELLAARDQHAGRGVLRIEATTGSGGVVARQMIRALPGNHAFRGSIFDYDRQRDSGLYATVRCVGRDDTLTSFDLPAAGEKGQRFASAFTVPASRCAAQWVELWARASYDAGGVSASVDDLSVI